MPDASARSRHVEALDGLRGLGALVVVARHTLNSVAMSDEARRAILQSPLAVFLCGDGAVRMFFVLSGWVLAGSLQRGRGTASVLQFYVRRVFRIHPPYLFGVLWAWTVAFFHAAHYAGAPPSPALTEWHLRLGAVHLAWDRLLPWLVFPGHAGTQLPVGWTLTVEMVFSFLMPLLLLAARPLHGLPLITFALALLVAWPAVHVPAHALDFALGVVSFRERATLGRLVGALPATIATLGLGAAVVLQAAPAVFGWSLPIVGILVTPSDAVSGLCMSIGAWGLVLAALFRPWPRRVLSARPLVAVGDVSYSLYLLHMPVLLACGLALGAPLGWSGGLGLLAVVLALSLPLAAAGWHWIERPSIAAGDAVCAWLAARLGTETLRSSLPSRAR